MPDRNLLSFYDPRTWEGMEREIPRMWAEWGRSKGMLDPIHELPPIQQDIEALRAAARPTGTGGALLPRRPADDVPPAYREWGAMVRRGLPLNFLAAYGAPLNWNETPLDLAMPERR